MARAHIRVVAGVDHYDLSEGRVVTFGRDRSTNDLAIGGLPGGGEDTGVSRQAGELAVVDGVVHLTNLSTYDPILIWAEGRRRPHTLEPGDETHIHPGRTVLHLRGQYATYEITVDTNPQTKSKDH